MKTMRFLWISLVAVLVVCVGAFTWMTAYMSQQNEKAVGEIGEIYLDQMGKQIQLHFTSAVELYLSQVESIEWRTPAESVATSEEARNELVASIADLDFNYAALYSVDGESETLTGSATNIENKDAFLRAAAHDEDFATSALGSEGETLLLLGIAAHYPMSNGQTSQTLIVGLPIEDVSRTLSLDVSETQVYSHIITRDGSFVLSSSDIDESSYFTYLNDVADDENGELDTKLNQIKEAIAENRDISLTLSVDGEVINLYFAPLAHTDWYIVSVLPQGLISSPVSSLVNDRTAITLTACGLILLAVLVVFFVYFRMSRRQMEATEAARLEADSANMVKSRFLSSMSHDIRTPMNAIVGMAAIATAKMDNPQVVKDCLNKITLSSKHLLGLINDVLDMSKIESGKLSLNMAPVSLREVAEAIVGIVQGQAKAKNLYFDVFVEEVEVETIRCDGVRLNQVLLNLLSNALKFTPEGGSVSLTIAQTSSSRGAGWVSTSFVVHDTGIGMSKEFMERIFDSFSREDTSDVRRIEGTGLGMAITKSIVDEMGGTISIESTEGEGSTFTVVIDSECIASDQASLTLPGWTMLIVDDDEYLCKSAAHTLQEMDVIAEWTTSGSKALDLVSAHCDHQDAYRAVLIDWQMPSMDGIECARRIRQRIGNKAPILLISAYDWSEVEDEARAAGIDGFISKPLFASTLYDALSRFEEDPCQDQVNVDEEPEKPLDGFRILLAEDQELNWIVASELLHMQGATLDWAENGQVCVDRFAASREHYYDAILMDVQMPVMNGYEATRAIRSLAREDARTVPIIAMTADAFSEDAERSLMSGMDAHASKPIDVNELVRLLYEKTQKRA